MLGLKRVHINRLKVIAWRCWNDGIDVDVSPAQTQQCHTHFS